jgi:hypothetical protein
MTGSSSWHGQRRLQLVVARDHQVNVQARPPTRQQTARAEAILQECLQLQAHLLAQDAILDDVMRRMERVAPA